MNYRQHALLCLGDFMDVDKNVAWYEEVYSVTQPVIQDLLDDAHEMDVDSKSGSPSSKVVAERTLANAVRTLLRSVITGSGAEENHLQANLTQCIEIVTETLLQRRERVVQEAILEGEKSLFQQVAGLEPTSALDDILIRFASTLFEQEEQRVESTRTKAAEAAAELAVYAAKGGSLKEALASVLSAARQRERSQSVQQVLDRALERLR